MSTNTIFEIEGTPIGPHRAPYIVAEIAQTHDGSLGSAMAFIDVAKECGADAVKFQTHIAEEESTAGEPWRKNFSLQDATRYDYWKRVSFTRQEWGILKRHADNVGISFLSSPFSIMACEWLRDLGMRTWKVASGELHNRQYLDWIIATGNPILVSTGLSGTADFRPVLDLIRSAGNPLAILHCTTQYPTPPDQVGMNIFSAFFDEFLNMPIGVSDHSGEIYPSLVAAYLGAQIVEVHLTLHKKAFGPDVPASLTPDQLLDVVRGTHFVWQMRENPVVKETQLVGLTQVRNIFTRSLVAARDISAGETVTPELIAYKKPGGGMPYEHRDKLVGKTAIRPIVRDQMMSESDVK